MLPPLYRLRAHQDFQRVYRGGKTLNTAFFRIKTMTNDLPHPRFGIVVSNVLIKKAVERNRKKRQIRAALSRLSAHVLPGYDIVLLAQPPVVKSTVAEIEYDLRVSFEKIHFLVNAE